MPKLLIFLLFAFLIFNARPLSAQDTANPPVPPATAQFPQHPGDLSQGQQPSEAERKMEREQEKKRNQERQAQLKRDTDKLFLLATQLKQAVDKSNEDTLSLEVIKKAGEIEKLAKSVREKMRGQN